MSTATPLLRQGAQRHESLSRRNSINARFRFFFSRLVLVKSFSVTSSYSGVSYNTKHRLLSIQLCLREGSPKIQDSSIRLFILLSIRLRKYKALISSALLFCVTYPCIFCGIPLSIKMCDLLPQLALHYLSNKVQLQPEDVSVHIITSFHTSSVS